MNDGFVFPALEWIWLPVWRTGLEPEIARISIIPGADSRGIFDKAIHFDVQTGQIVVPGRQFDQELVRFLKPFLEIPDRLLFRQSLVGSIREKINGHEIFSFPVDFNKSLHAQVRLSDFVLITVCETRQARLKIPGRTVQPAPGPEPCTGEKNQKRHRDPDSKKMEGISDTTVTLHMLPPGPVR